MECVNSLNPSDTHHFENYDEYSQFFDNLEKKRFDNRIPQSARYQRREDDSDGQVVINTGLAPIVSEEKIPSMTSNFLEDMIVGVISKFSDNKLLTLSAAMQIVSLLTYVFSLWHIKKFSKGLLAAITLQITSVISTFSVIFGFPLNRKEMQDIISESISSSVNSKFSLQEHINWLNVNAKTKRDILEYLSRNYLNNRVSLPIVSFHELAKPENDWIWNEYSDSFLAAWYGKTVSFVLEQRRIPYVRLEKQTQHTVMRSGIEFAQRFLGIVLSWLMHLIDGKPFSVSSVKDGIMIGNTISNCSSDLIKDFIDTFDSDKKYFEKQVTKYVDDLEKFLETPNYEFSNNLRYVYDISDELKEIRTFISDYPKEQQQQIIPLMSIFAAASKRKNEILTSMSPEFHRQEPFLILLRGPGAIGKTYFAQHLAKRIVKELIPDGDLKRDYIEVRHDDKYWPPLAGQRVAFFDEAGTVRNIADDLLFSNIKGLCSTAYFNCPAADVEHKVTPCPFHVIIATTNSELDDIQGKYGAFAGPASVYSMWRRLLVVDCKWAGETKLNLNDPTGHRSDFSHIEFTRCEWDDSKSRMVKTETIGPEKLFNIAAKMYQKRYIEHKRNIDLQRVEKQAEHRMHYTLHMHGPPGQGKTPALLNLASKLSSLYSMPVFVIKELRDFQQLRFKDNPSIFVFDDIFDNNCSVELQHEFMNIYNNIMPNNSIVLVSSNISTGYSMKPYLNLTNIYFPRTLKFKVTGIIRRLGFCGRFDGLGDMPGYNREYYCLNNSFFRCSPKPINRFLLFLAFISLPLSFWNAYFLFMCLPLFFSLRRLHDRVLVNDIVEDAYSSYKEFVRMRHDIPINIVDELPNAEYNFCIKIPKPQEFTLPRNILQLDKHVTISKQVYDDSHDDWKMYFSNDIAKKLRCVYHKFFINDTNLSDEVVTRELRRCARSMLEYGVQPVMLIEINNLGRYAFFQGAIYKQYKNDSNNDNDIAIFCSHTSIVLNSTNRILEIPIHEVFGNINVAIKYELTLLEALEYSKFVKSSKFLSLDHIRKFLVEKQKQDFQLDWSMRYKKLTDKVEEIKRQPFGKFLICLYSILALFLVSAVAYKIFGYFFKTRKRVNNICDTDSECDIEQDRGKGGRKRNPKYYSDVEQDKGKGSRRKNPKVYSDIEQDNLRSRISTEEVSRAEVKQLASLIDCKRQGLEKQDVRTLCDMNDYDAYKKYIENAYTKATKNLAQVYMVASDVPVMNVEPIGQQMCYALFLRGNMFVTVGHIADNISGWFHLYIGCDSFGGKFYRCKLLKTYKSRDLSFWSCDIKQSFPDITKLFLTRKQMYDYQMVNAVIQRYAPNKEKIWIQGCCDIVQPYYSTGNGGISEFGYVDFATIGIQLTYYGDCGLPYYVAEKDFAHDKILGLHCMGNVDGYSSVGIVALIMQEDFADLDRQTACDFCSVTKTRLAPASIPKCDNHEIVWNGNHESNAKAFVEELKFHDELRTSFTGMVIKNSGPLLRGSVSHSHTQFLSGMRDETFVVTRGWVTTTASELGFDSPRINPNSTFSYRVIDVSYGGLYTCLNNIGYASNFRLYANVYNKGHKRAALVKIIIPMEEVPSRESQFSLSKQAIVPLNIDDEQVVHVNGDIFDVMNQHMQRLRRGMLPDIAYEDIPDNETVQVIGVAHRNMSPLPPNSYMPTPFHMVVGDTLGAYKLPVRFDANNAPQEVKDRMFCDRCGNPDPRITQSIAWAHPNFSPGIELRKFVKSEYMANILEGYSGMNLLTDHQLFHGYESGHRLRGGLQPLEIDSSIGWTLKQIFNVTHKSDVIHLSDKGVYSWKDNECADFAKSMFEVSMMQAEAGIRYWTVFNELLKMEKLKPEKQFLPRTFTANDLNGVLMERKILGEFTARAMLWDKTCSVGINVYSDFDQLTREMSKFKNQFTIDYSKYDRSIPACIFEDICELLVGANPHLKHHLNSCFKTLINRIQVSGNTIALVKGGMPSGCIPTAPLNSKCNDFIIYSIYVSLCWDANHEEFAYYAVYNRKVVRRFYGDDGWISCDDDIADFFNSVTVARKAKQLFGMTITPSSKQGIQLPFDEPDQISFISRFPRKLDRYNFIVGALKKISISTHFHWTIDCSPKQLGEQLTIAQLEASFWEESYFLNVQEQIRVAIRKVPEIRQYFCFRTREFLQQQTFEGAYLSGVKRHQGINLVDSELYEKRIVDKTEEIILRYTQTENEYKLFIEKLNLLRYKRTTDILTYINSEEYKKMSKFSHLNHLFQRGVLSRPSVDYEAIGLDWSCKIEVLLISSKKTLTGIGKGVSKTIAKEFAAEMICSQLSKLENERSRFIKQSMPFMEPQMNVSASLEHKTLGAPMIAPDPTVTPDSGLVTNTMTPSPCRVINPGAISLDNPAGTGAAFDKRDSIYGIYQRWPEKSAIVNGSLQEGAEVVRISLDPKTLPARIREYVNFHEYIIPAIDVQIVIGGAAGTIGWLKIGWVPDDTLKYGLDDLQAVACETVNMNGTITMCTLLTDNRQYGMYRKVQNDSEPWPALIIMVDHPALNVQRNDDVGYPVRVNVRLAPTCALMYPNRLISGAPEVGTKLSLKPFLNASTVDFLIGSSKILNEGISLLEYPECGYLSGNFNPTFTDRNCINAHLRRTNYIVFTDNLGKITLGTKIAQYSTQKFEFPSSIDFAYGQIPSVFERMTIYPDAKFGSFSNYTIQPLFITNGVFIYKCTTMYVFESGCILHFSIDGNYWEITVSGSEITTIGQAYEPDSYYWGTYNMLVAKTTDANVVYNKTPLDFDSLNVFKGQFIYSTYFGGKWQRALASYINLPIDENIDGFTDRKKWFLPDQKRTTTLYDWTYVLTGNSLPATALPNGLKTAFMVRPGTSTTTTDDAAFAPITAPGIHSLYKTLNDYLVTLNTELIIADLVVAGNILGKVGYVKNAFLTRTSGVKVIKTALTTDIQMINITAASNTSAISVLNVGGFASWSGSNTYFVGRVFSFQSAFMALGMAAQAGSNMMQAIGNGLMYWDYKSWQDARLDKQNALRLQLMEMQNEAAKQVQAMRNQNEIDKIQKQAEIKQSLLGYSGNSAQNGNLEGRSRGESVQRPPILGVEANGMIPRVPLQSGTKTELRDAYEQQRTKFVKPKDSISNYVKVDGATTDETDVDAIPPFLDRFRSVSTAYPEVADRARQSVVPDLPIPKSDEPDDDENI
nr:MAG: polyprotein [Apis picorna-like virus 4]